MEHYYKTGQLDMFDRIAIETGICRGDSFNKIARRIKRHTRVWEKTSDDDLQKEFRNALVLTSGWNSGIR